MTDTLLHRNRKAIVPGLAAAGMMLCMPSARAQEEHGGLIAEAWDTLCGNASRIARVIILAVLVVVFGMLFLRLGRMLIRRICSKTESGRAHRRKAGQRENAGDKTFSDRRTAGTFITSVFSFVMYFIILMLLLTLFGIDVTGLVTLAGIGGVAIGLGSQTLVKDFIGGLFLLLDGFVKVGDIITVNGVTGTVEAVALRTTSLRCVNGNLQVIPNGDIRAVTNMTRDYRCAMVDITVAHGQDYTHALEVLKEAMAHYDDQSDLIDEPPDVLGIIASDGRAATVRIECRCRVQDCWAIERGIRLQCLEAFRKENIKP